MSAPISRAKAFTALAIVCCLGLGLSGVASASGEATEFELGAGTVATALTSGPDGNLWFAATKRTYAGAGDVIGRISPRGEVTEFPLPSRPESELGVSSIVSGGDGYLYFTETAANRIGRISTGGYFEDSPLPRPGSRPMALALAADGTLWASEEGIDSVVRLDNTSGIATEYKLAPGARPSGIAAADGLIWVSQPGTGTIGRVNPGNPTASFPLLDRHSLPGAMVPGPTGKIWFAEGKGPQIGRVTASTSLQVRYVQQSVPGNGGTSSIVYGPRGDFWFTVGNRIGSISPSSDVTDPACVAGGCDLSVTALAVGPEGELWYATPNTIGRFDPPRPRGEIARRGGRLAGRFVSFQIGCRSGVAGDHCKGSVKVRAGSSRSGKAGPAPVLHTGRFDLPTYYVRRVRFKIPRRLAEDLATRKRPTLQVTVTVRGGRSASRRLLLHIRGPGARTARRSYSAPLAKPARELSAAGSVLVSTEP